MSRSYKKTPYAGDRKNKFIKNYFNRKLRRRKDEYLFQNNSYKKASCSYDICDYCNISSFQQYLDHRKRYHMSLPIENLNEEYRYWYKCYKRK